MGGGGEGCGFNMVSIIALIYLLPAIAYVNVLTVARMRSTFPTLSLSKFSQVVQLWSRGYHTVLFKTSKIKRSEKNGSTVIIPGW